MASANDNQDKSLTSEEIKNILLSASGCKSMKEMFANIRARRVISRQRYVSGFYFCNEDDHDGSVGIFIGHFTYTLYITPVTFHPVVDYAIVIEEHMPGKDPVFLSYSNATAVVVKDEIEAVAAYLFGNG